MMRDYKIGGVNECCMPPISSQPRESTARRNERQINTVRHARVSSAWELGNVWNQGNKENVTSTDMTGSIAEKGAIIFIFIINIVIATL